jgi:hypothetical protein
LADDGRARPADPVPGTGAGPAGQGDGGDLAAGPGRVLVALYGFFALAAGARAAVQLATQFGEAPVAYVLSAVAAVVYVVATVGLARGGRAGLRTAGVACSVELAGVLVVGTLSLADRTAFPDATVWSGYGRGYGFVPLALPVLGLLWLRHKALEARPDDEPDDEPDEGPVDEPDHEPDQGPVDEPDQGPVEGIKAPDAAGTAQKSPPPPPVSPPSQPPSSPPSQPLS